MKLLSLSVVLSAIAAAQAPIDPQKLEFVTAFVGPTGGIGSLHLFEDEGGEELSSPGWAQGIRLCGFDFVGRTELGRFDPTMPRYRSDVPGACRLTLPGDQGTLYHYERLSGPQPAFGYFVIQPDGRPQRVMELPAIGTSSPFLPRLAVSANGKTLLIGTTIAAGGDLYQVDVVSGQRVARTTTLPPQAFSDAGLWLLRGWGLAVTSEGVLRFPLATEESAAFVPFPSSPAWFSGQAVSSPSRTVALITAGSGPDFQQAFVVASQGAARRVSDVPSRLSGAGFLPESDHGPYMAVTDDGGLAAWRVEFATSREARVGRLDNPQAEVEVTGNSYFIDTIDEIGQVYAFQPDAITMTIGSLNDEGRIESVDVFDIALDPAGSPTFVNRSLSSGDGQPPFQVPGEITPEFMYRHPDGNSLLMFDESEERFLSVDGSGMHVLKGNMKELYALEPAADRWLVACRSDLGNKPGELYSVDASMTGWTALPGAGNDMEFFDAVGSGVGQVLIRRVFADTQTRLLRVNLFTQQVDVWTPGPPGFTPPFAFTEGGAALFSEDLGTSNRVMVWDAVGGTSLMTPPGQAIVLQ